MTTSEFLYLTVAELETHEFGIDYEVLDAQLTDVVIESQISSAEVMVRSICQEEWLAADIPRNAKEAVAMIAAMKVDNFRLKEGIFDRANPPERHPTYFTDDVILTLGKLIPEGDAEEFGVFGMRSNGYNDLDNTRGRGYY